MVETFGSVETGVVTIGDGVGEGDGDGVNVGVTRSSNVFNRG